MTVRAGQIWREPDDDGQPIYWQIVFVGRRVVELRPAYRGEKGWRPGAKITRVVPGCFGDGAERRFEIEKDIR